MHEHDGSAEVAVARPQARLSRPQRLALTATLAIGLLGVGGVALVQAADPTLSPTTTTTTSPTGTAGGTATDRSGHDCPNKSASSSTTSSSNTTSGSN